MRHLWVEPELKALLNLIVMLESQLSNLSDKCVESSDADSFGYFNTMEHIVGMAMVAGQTYIATVCGAVEQDKSDVLKLGPVHRSGKSNVEIINHSANYWKHNNEWGNKPSDRRRQEIEAAFESVGFPVGTEYPLSGVLTELCNPTFASLEVIGKILQEWKSEVTNAA